MDGWMEEPNRVRLINHFIARITTIFDEKE
jgi:ribosomal protein L29